MGLWGKSTSVESRPKFLKGDGAEGAGGRTEDAFATTGGWALRAGTAASGNDNANAQPEVLFGHPLRSFPNNIFSHF